MKIIKCPACKGNGCGKAIDLFPSGNKKGDYIVIYECCVVCGGCGKMKERIILERFEEKIFEFLT